MHHRVRFADRGRAQWIEPGDTAAVGEGHASQQAVCDDPRVTTRNLAVYAAIVSTVSLLWAIAWTVYSQAFRDRPRIKQIVSMAPTGDAVSIVILNRGRRPIHVLRIERVRSVWRGTIEMSLLPERQARGATIEEGRSRSYQAGGKDDYEAGHVPLTRWYFLDEAARIFPLRERYRQRVERVLFWPARKL